MLRYFFSTLASLLITSAALAQGNGSRNPVFGDSISNAVCNNGQCMIFRVTLQIDINATVSTSHSDPQPQTRIVVDNKVYFDDNGESIKYTTRVINQDNICEKRYVIEEHAYRTMAAVFDSIVDETGAIIPQMNKTQQAFMGFFLSLIEDKSQFECTASDLGSDK